MPKKLTLVVMSIVIAATGANPSMSQEHLPKPPTAKKVAKTTRILGDTLVDDYFWLREKSNPEVISYLEAENAYTDAIMKPTET
ncbi:MAG: oligopeptidase B, partial [Acidobacteriota bacterium]